MNAVIENQIKLLGYDIDKTVGKAGQSLTITYYFEALSDPMGDNNMLFHLRTPETAAPG